jgi:chemotaxis protein MotA
VDLATLIGIILAFVAIIGGFMLEGGSPLFLFNIPAILIVVGGTVATIFLSNPMSRITSMVSVVMHAFFDRGHDPRHTADLLVSLAEQARREGLLSLESKVAGITDPFIKKGLMLMVDGTDPARLRSILEIELGAREERHESGIAVLEAAGGFAPTIGILGAVLGLMNALSNLEDPSKLGHMIAVAFVASFYAVFIANLGFLPLAGKLKTRMKHEAHIGEMALEGILAIQAGDNPRIVREKLDSFLPPKQRSGDGNGGGDGRQRAAA